MDYEYTGKQQKTFRIRMAMTVYISGKPVELVVHKALGHIKNADVITWDNPKIEIYEG